MKRRKFLPYRRKREGRTNYKRRLRLLQSKKLRLVIRKSLKNVTVQVVGYKTFGDETLISAGSKELKALGWKGYTRNIPAGYLVGYLCGMKAKKQNVTEAILDQGLYSSRQGILIYAVLKGFIDAGVEVPHDPMIFPAEERIQGKHISEEIAISVEAVKARIGKE